MNILFIVRDTFYASQGGDTVQVLSTAKYLRLLGLTIDIKLTSSPTSYNEYQLIHFFNIIRPADILPHIFKSKLKFVVSTIFVDYFEFERKNRTGIFKYLTAILDADQIEYLKVIARYFTSGDKIKSAYYLLHGHKNSIKFIIEKTELLLPNSHSEYNRLKVSYNITNNYRKIPNAIDPFIFKSNIKSNPAFIDHVICVGRIEGRKNQLNLIKAMAETGISLTLIGKPAPNQSDYFKQCKELVERCDHMQIIEHIDQSELASIYKAAKVHVLASWFETTGLSSLEAAVMDCNVVITKKGDTEEYFHDMAYYCEPGNIESIKLAVIKAFKDPVSPKLKETVCRDYIWEKAANETLEAYNSVLNIT